MRRPGCRSSRLENGAKPPGQQNFFVTIDDAVRAYLAAHPEGSAV
jgi:hypothetical protein